MAATPQESLAPVKLRQIGMSLAARLWREHPTLLFTLGYIGLTLVGLIYDLWFFAYFKINILNYSETSDFLLAAIRNPLVIILAIVPVFMLMGMQALRTTARKKSAWYDSRLRKYEHTRWNSPNLRMGLYGAFIAVYAITFTQIYALRVANGIRAGGGRRVEFVRNSGPPATTEKPIMIGSTTKFFFLYYPLRKETEVVPVDNTASIRIDSRRRKEREQDSLAALRQKR